MEQENRRKDRARGCLMGQLAGDSLGSLVEFQSAGEIRRRYPEGVRELADGGMWNTLAGQPTDDSEMALVLARSLAELGFYRQEALLAGYRSWLESKPFDCGATTEAGLQGRRNYASQANGALMRVSPLGIFTSHIDEEEAARLAALDAMITHPHPVCVQANQLYVLAIRAAVREPLSGEELYGRILKTSAKLKTAAELKVDRDLMGIVERARSSPPDDYSTHQGWVLIALQNALWQLLHAGNPEEGIVDTVMRGGDTDTNAAICGALLGAVYGASAIPERWRAAVLSCRAEEGKPGVFRPRPAVYWPTDALELADRLAGAGADQ
jgi:ADP-ribosyl-[dinitrogen reductase] hydrolase